MHRRVKVYGTSGGALSGALLFMDCDLDALVQYVYICAARARRSVWGAFQLRSYCRGAMTEFCDPEAHKLVEGRFEVSITRIFPTWKNLRIRRFPSYDFFIQALLCSSCIVPLCGLPLWLKGFGLCLDGALTDMQVWKGFPKKGTFSKLHCKEENPNIVVINPFYSSRADIKPNKYIPIWWCLYPPEPYKLKQLFDMGYEDAHEWFDRDAGLSPSKKRQSETADGEIKADVPGAPDVETEELHVAPRTYSGWATECQQWASQSAETAALRTAAAAESARRAAARHAEEFGSFMKHEAEMISKMRFRASEVAASAKKTIAELKEQKKDEESTTFASRADAAAHATLDAFVVVGKGSIVPFRLILKVVSCLLVYAELLIQASLAFAGATLACIFPGKVRKQGDELWERCKQFSEPLPRVLLQAVPGIKVEAKINERTAKSLGELSAFYRLLCYLIHMEEREWNVVQKA